MKGWLTEATQMSRFISKRAPHEEILDNPPFPLAGAVLGLLAVVNVASTMATLLAL
jgi:hypothetical protein